MGIRTNRRHLSRAAARNIAEVTKALAPANRKKTAQKYTKRTEKQKNVIKSAKNDVKVEESSPESSFKCSKCNATFMLRIQLAVHARQHNKKTKKVIASKSSKIKSPVIEEANSNEAIITYKEPKIESLDEPSEQNDIKVAKCEDMVPEDELATQPNVLECYIVNENSENQENEPEFVDVYTVVEVKEVEIEQDQPVEEDAVVPKSKNPKTKKKTVGGSSCEFCGRTFRHKKNIRPHVNKKHPDKVVAQVPDTTNYHACEFCERKFKYRKNLNAHIRLKHPEAVIKPVVDGDRPYECHLCDRKLKYKRNLNAHIRAKHLVLFPGDYTCNSCGRRFLFRKNLLVHLRNKHPSEVDPSPILPCNACGETFRTTSALRKHKSSQHPIQTPIAVFPKKCPLCPYFTSQKLPIIQHFSDTHDIAIEVNHLEFQEMVAFYDWKESLEKETNCRYTKISTGKFEDHTTLIFQCHRSGRSRKGKNANGVLSKSSVSLKMNAYCPAQIYVVDYYTVIKVRYTSTHVGHDNETIVKRVDQKNRASLLNSMVQEAISELPEESTPQEVSHPEPKQIVLRVGNKSRIDEKTRSVEMKTIDDWVKVHEADVLFYKKTGDASQLHLYEGELVLIIMNKEQRSMLQKYGKKFICVHTIHDCLKYAFAWTTIMVLNNSNEPVPVAFLISNRTSAEVYQTFFRCVIDASGPIQTEVFMGDKNEEMYWAWSEVSRPAEQFLFCPWQVLDDWKMNAVKISDEVKRKSVMNLLENILVEAKYEAFEDELNSFIECSDDDVQKFREYFVENYMETIPAWAYCYRLESRVEGNLTEQDFKKIFTPSSAVEEGRTLISVTEALLTLDKYNAFKGKTKDPSSVQIVGLEGLIEIIEDNHRRALNCEFQVDNVIKTEEGWLLSTMEANSGVEKTYKIHENEILPCVDCKIACPSCNSCFHRFSCSCTDNKKKLAMCDHIHFIGDSLQSGKILVA